MQANANVTFNTHKAVKALKSSGFDEEQAEAVVETIDKAVNETVATKSDLGTLGKTVGDIQDDIKENMATKADLGVLGKTVGDIQDDIKENMATKADLALLVAKMATKDDIASLERRMMRIMLFQSTVLVGMLITVIGMLAPVVVKLL